MKINRLVALTIIALLVVGAMGVITFKVFAWSVAGLRVQTQACNQGECDDQEESEASEANEIDETEGLAPAQTRITEDQARSIAELAYPGSATLTVEFEREAGSDIWEVVLDNGLEVEVDASSGTILGTEGQD